VSAEAGDFRVSGEVVRELLTQADTEAARILGSVPEMLENVLLVGPAGLRQFGAPAGEF
jgi:hypothetical protein